MTSIPKRGINITSDWGTLNGLTYFGAWVHEITNLRPLRSEPNRSTSVIRSAIAWHG